MTMVTFGINIILSHILKHKIINEIIGKSRKFIRDSKIQAITVVKVFCFG